MVKGVKDIQRSTVEVHQSFTYIIFLCNDHTMIIKTSLRHDIDQDKVKKRKEMKNACLLNN